MISVFIIGRKIVPRRISTGNLSPNKSGAPRSPATAFHNGSAMEESTLSPMYMQSFAQALEEFEFFKVMETKKTSCFEMS